MPEKTTPAKPSRPKTGEKDQRATGTAKPARKPAAAPEKTTEGDRIAKVLSRAGISSRREAERLIEMGEVQVNGKTVTSPALNVTSKDRITVSGQPVGAPEPARLWLYYKPEGLVTSASDEKGRDTVFDNLPEDMPRVMSIGRLDLNSEGLLLLTNDGALKRQLELPSTGWLRKYRVRVKGNPTDPDLEPLRRGITIEGERFQPMEISMDRHQGANAWLTVGLREGKNREIRRAMMAVNLTVNRLIRVSYGPFRLNEMQPGDVEEVRAKVLRDQLGALMSGHAEADDDLRPVAKTGARGGARAGTGTATKPATTSRLRTSARSGGDQGIARRPAREGDDAPAPRRTANTGKPRADAAPGTVTTARGRAALQTLSDAWGKATKPARGASARPTAGDDAPTPRRRVAKPAGEGAERPPRTYGTAARSTTKPAGDDAARPRRGPKPGAPKGKPRTRK